MLEVANLEVVYNEVILVLRGLSIDVPDGKIVALLGANGAGKTTLMKTVSGVMDPEKGKINFEGAEIQGCEPHEVVRKGIVHVPEGREVFPLLTVDENLDLGAYTSKDKGQIDHDRDLVFSCFPILKERRTQEAGTLSGGQQQMLAIGRGLMANPKVMLLDEPSLGLSPLLVQEIFDILKRLNDEHNMTMMLVEQNANAALKLAHHGYVMEVGRIVLDGAADVLMQSDDIRNFYLGVHEEGARKNRRWKRKKTWR